MGKEEEKEERPSLQQFVSVKCGSRVNRAEESEIPAAPPPLQNSPAAPSFAESPLTPVMTKLICPSANGEKV